MDTFLIALGEAMACGSVPIATAQLGMAHFGHRPDPLGGSGARAATGFALNRSFREDDAELADALADRIRLAVRLLHDQPSAYRRLSGNAVATAHAFTWARCADLHLEQFLRLWDGLQPQLTDDDALRAGWFDLLSESAWADRRDEIARLAEQTGDLDTYSRCRGVDADVARCLFDAAYARGDFARCEHIASTVGVGADGVDAERLHAVRNRCHITVSPAGWQIRYRQPHAAHVELVVPTTPPHRTARAEPRVAPLGRAGETFTGHFDGPPPGDEVRLLVTLTDGRVAWDHVRRHREVGRG
jgi:hypothetical protein